MILKGLFNSNTIDSIPEYQASAPRTVSMEELGIIASDNVLSADTKAVEIVSDFAAKFTHTGKVKRLTVATYKNS